MKGHWDQRKKLALGAIFNPATTWKAQGQELRRDIGFKKKKRCNENEERSCPQEAPSLGEKPNN